MVNDCEWHLKKRCIFAAFSLNILSLLLTDYKIRIRFTAFQVESANNNGVCAFDYIEIFDGDNENAPLFGKFCGADLPPIIVTSGQDLTVVFVADDTIQEFGFRASVTSVPWYYRGKSFNET